MLSSCLGHAGFGFLQQSPLMSLRGGLLAREVFPSQYVLHPGLSVFPLHSPQGGSLSMLPLRLFPGGFFCYLLLHTCGSGEGSFLGVPAKPASSASAVSLGLGTPAQGSWLSHGRGPSIHSCASPRARGLFQFPSPNYSGFISGQLFVPLSPVTSVNYRLMCITRRGSQDVQLQLILAVSLRFSLLTCELPTSGSGPEHWKIRAPHCVLVGLSVGSCALGQIP